MQIIFFDIFLLRRDKLMGECIQLVAQKEDLLCIERGRRIFQYLDRCLDLLQQICQRTGREADALLQKGKLVENTSALRCGISNEVACIIIEDTDAVAKRRLVGHDKKNLIGFGAVTDEARFGARCAKGGLCIKMRAVGIII